MLVPLLQHVHTPTQPGQNRQYYDGSKGTGAGRQLCVAACIAQQQSSQ